MIAPSTTNRSNDPPVHHATTAELIALARMMIVPGERRVLGITGAPGAGKSTLCTALAQALGENVAVVAMDGFHLASQELERLQRRHRKGAPDTFDVGGYTALLQRLRAQGSEIIYAPVFDRQLEESIGSAVPISAAAPLIITEGNYLLLDSGPWHHVGACLDTIWFLEVPDEIRLRWLVARHEAHGKPPLEAQQWVEQVDQRNAELIAATRTRADLVIRLRD